MKPRNASSISWFSSPGASNVASCEVSLPSRSAKLRSQVGFLQSEDAQLLSDTVFDEPPGTDVYLVPSSGEKGKIGAN